MAITDQNPRFKAKISKGNIIYNDSNLFLAILGKMEGKTVFVTLVEPFAPTEKDLYAFYFGIIIRKECMSSESFKSHFSEMEIHGMLERQLRTFVQPVSRTDENGKTYILPVEKQDEVLRYDKKDFQEYLNDVINFLAAEFSIHVKEYDEYLIDRVRLTKKSK